MEKQEFVERLLSVSSAKKLDFEPGLFRLISRASVTAFKRGGDNFALIFAVKSWLPAHITDSESEKARTALRRLAEILHEEYCHDATMRADIDTFFAEVSA